jgi:hypothetical protein
MGKSNISRYLAVCVSKGVSCLDRKTTKGEVLLVSLEDPEDHVDDSLEMLGYNRETDSKIEILEELPATFSESLEVIEMWATNHPDARLIVIDTLPKFIRVSDLNDYGEVQIAMKKLRDVARKHRHVHIMVLTHLKKTATDNVLEAIGGSTAIRGEADANIGLYQLGQDRIIVTEVRRGRDIPPTVLCVDKVISPMDGAEIISNFRLEGSLQELTSVRATKADERKSRGFDEQVIGYLESQADGRATQLAVTDNIVGRRAEGFKAIKNLVELGVLTKSGKHSEKDPLTLSLDRDGLTLYRLGTDHKGGK